MCTPPLNIYNYEKNAALPQHLALDELLLNYVNSNPQSSGIRFYDSQNLSIVLGLANKIDEHVHLEACDRVEWLENHVCLQYQA